MSEHRKSAGVTRVILIAMLSAPLVVLAPGTAGAADVTAPVLTAPVKAAFLVGGSIDVGNIPDCAPQDQPWDLGVYAPETFHWSATDAGGPVTYDLFAENAATGGDYVFERSSATSYSSPFAGTTWDQSCGGGNWSVTRWVITAHDAAGNSTERSVTGGRVRLTQEDGKANTTSTYAVSPSVTYAGNWGTARCGCWSAGSVRKTTSPGASVTMAVPVAVGNVVHLGLVMSKAPNRGRFKVYVDGTLNATVDTYAPTSQNRIIVWERPLGNGTHKVKVVNEGTPGRARIDLDAVLTN